MLSDEVCKRVCGLCAVPDHLTPLCQYPVNFEIPNGVYCQASRSAGIVLTSYDPKLAKVKLVPQEGSGFERVANILPEIRRMLRRRLRRRVEWNTRQMRMWEASSPKPDCVGPVCGKAPTWTFRFKGRKFEIILDGECRCPVMFLKQLATNQGFDQIANRVWVFRRRLFYQDDLEEGFLEESIRNNCPPEVAALLDGTR